MTLAMKLQRTTKPDVDYSANMNGIWDRSQAIDAVPITINRGRGFEPALRVTVPEGQFIYCGPFVIEPTKPHERVMFHVGQTLFIKNI